MEMFKTEREVLEVIEHMRIMTTKQLVELFTRNGKSERSIELALNSLWTNGRIFRDDVKPLWKITKKEKRLPEYIYCIWLMLAHTRGANDELAIYKTVSVGIDYQFAYIKDGRMYYLLYFKNRASQLSFQTVEERILRQGTKDSKDLVRLICVAEEPDVLLDVTSQFDILKAVFIRNGNKMPEITFLL